MDKKMEHEMETGDILLHCSWMVPSGGGESICERGAARARYACSTDCEEKRRSRIAAASSSMSSARIDSISAPSLLRTGSSTN